MFKLVKYELQGIYKELLGALIIMLVLALLLYTRIGTWQNGSIIGLTVIIIIAPGVWAFISSIKIYSKYMYDDTGYLMFTLPQNGYSIVTSRIIVALIQLWSILAMSILITKGILSKVITDEVMKQQIRITLSSIKTSDWLTLVLSITFSWIYMMMLIYFCVTLSKVVINRRKMGKLGAFIIFIVLTIALGNFSSWLEKTFPSTISIFHSVSTSTTLNTASSIFDVITMLIFFFLTSYFIDKKLEL